MDFLSVHRNLCIYFYLVRYLTTSIPSNICVSKHQNITSTLSTKNTCKYLEGMMILTRLSIYIKAQRKHVPNDIGSVNSKFGQTESLVVD